MSSARGGDPAALSSHVFFSVRVTVKRRSRVGGELAIFFHRPPQGTRKTTKKILHERTPWRVALSPLSARPSRAR
jgi:hypothetical protein